MKGEERREEEMVDYRFLGENRQIGTDNGGRSKRKSRWDVKGEEKEDDGYEREERERRKEREESRYREIQLKLLITVID